MATLTDALNQVLGGAGRCVVVVGEPGIGKTRLVTELAAAATAEGVRVVWGRCHEADVSPAYWPWVPIVRALAGTAPPPEVAALLAPTAVAPALDADSGRAADLRRGHPAAGHRGRRSVPCSSCSRTFTGPTPRRCGC